MREELISKGLCFSDIFATLYLHVDLVNKAFLELKNKVLLPSLSRKKVFFGYGRVVQLVRIRACHARGRGFESRPDRLRLPKLV